MNGTVRIGDGLRLNPNGVADTNWQIVGPRLDSLHMYLILEPPRHTHDRPSWMCGPHQPSC